jgi:predicted RNase H-like HicB family nuclease
MIREYMAAAMKSARYEILEDDGSYYGEIPGFQGVYSNAPQLEECRKMLEEVLEEWLLLSISMGFSVPVVDGLDLKARKVEDGTMPVFGTVADGDQPVYYHVPVEIHPQEDGLWRAESPYLKGCWVDAHTLEESLAQIHEVIVMAMDVYSEEGWPIPKEVAASDTLPLYTTVPVAPGEVKFLRIPQPAHEGKLH